MGWWKIRNVESGQIDWKAKTAAVHIDREAQCTTKLANAVPWEDDSACLYNGDGPADLMGDVLHKISREYEIAWGRPAKKDELTACFNFCCNGMF